MLLVAAIDLEIADLEKPKNDGVSHSVVAAMVTRQGPAISTDVFGSSS